MNWEWTNGPELSILLHRENGRDYAAEVLPNPDKCYGAEGFGWCVYRDERAEKWGWAADRDTAKVEAEAALERLVAANFA